MLYHIENILGIDKRDNLCSNHQRNISPLEWIRVIIQINYCRKYTAYIHISSSFITHGGHGAMVLFRAYSCDINAKIH